MEAETIGKEWAKDEAKQTDKEYVMYVYTVILEKKIKLKHK
jgi:hypothetical protein